MPKRKCYQEKYSQEWSFIRRGRNDHEVECIMCKCTSTLHMAENLTYTITSEVESIKQKCMLQASTSKRLDNYFVLKSSEQEKLVQVAELTMCYHTVKHHISRIYLWCFWA